MLNHWDNLDGTIERGYAGRSIFWPTLQTDKIEQYAQTNEALGINAIVPNNVNATADVLTEPRLQQLRQLADILRPHGIQLYLSINFASPRMLGATTTADPLDASVIRWWSDKVDEIYRLIPDFGGFLVKANSEGQPGPIDYGRTHAEGANMLARALQPHHGQVIWRAFVYSPSDPDRAKQAYLEFQPLDGQFLDNVIIQIKNGPIDFQPREPFSPLFDAMPHTRVMAELQITQEYLGHSLHTAFLAPMWTEFLQDLRRYTHCRLEGLAGVSNVGDGSMPGNDPTTLCGNRLAEANWYAFGRLTKNPKLSAHHIAQDWVKKELGVRDHAAQQSVTSMLLRSREAVVDYMMPLGLHHLFAWGHHYGPEPYCQQPGARADWMPSYYHRADAEGLGFNRSSHGGTDATHQYPARLAELLDNPEWCPSQHLLWFHHIPWTRNIVHQLGERQLSEPLWDALCHHYQHGVDEVAQMQREWESARGQVPDALHADMARRLQCQYADACWWRDACLLYFQDFCHLPLPQGVPAPAHSLEHYRRVRLGISNYECPTIPLLDRVR